MRQTYTSYGPNRIHKLFLKRKSADHRIPDNKRHRKVYEDLGTRVRKIKVLGEKVILKRSNDYSALEVLTALRKIVDEHNKLHPNSPYILKKPIGHPIGNRYLAMREADLPNLYELVGEQYGWNQSVTQRGKQHLIELSKKIKLTPEETTNKLIQAYTELYKNIRKLKKSKPYLANNGFFSLGNVLVAGYEKGKFVFVPLLDLN